ncbi:hypothetical protein F442_22408, partial [Phytophthora nicotianae P10297]
MNPSLDQEQEHRDGELEGTWADELKIAALLTRKRQDAAVQAYGNVLQARRRMEEVENLLHSNTLSLHVALGCVPPELRVINASSIENDVRFAREKYRQSQDHLMRCERSLETASRRYDDILESIWTA